MIWSANIHGKKLLYHLLVTKCENIEFSFKVFEVLPIAGFYPQKGVSSVWAWGS